MCLLWYCTRTNQGWIPLSLVLRKSLSWGASSQAGRAQKKGKEKGEKKWKEKGEKKEKGKWEEERTWYGQWTMCSQHCPVKAGGFYYTCGCYLTIHLCFSRVVQCEVCIFPSCCSCGTITECDALASCSLQSLAEQHLCLCISFCPEHCWCDVLWAGFCLSTNGLQATSLQKEPYW